MRGLNRYVYLILLGSAVLLGNILSRNPEAKPRGLGEVVRKSVWVFINLCGFLLICVGFY